VKKRSQAVIKKVLLALLLFAAVAFAGRFFGSAAPVDNSAPADSPLAGKFILVNVTTIQRGYVPANQDMQLLEKAQVKQLGGRQFLVGKHLEIDPEDSKAGYTVWLAVDSIQDMREFDSAADARKHLQPVAPPPAVAPPAGVPVVPVPLPIPAPPSTVPPPPANETNGKTPAPSFYR